MENQLGGGSRGLCPVKLVAPVPSDGRDRYRANAVQYLQVLRERERLVRRQNLGCARGIGRVRRVRWETTAATSSMTAAAADEEATIVSVKGVMSWDW